MNRRFKRVAVFGTVAALGLAGCGGQAATSTPPPPGQGGPDTSALAEALGVSETKLEKAMRATRPSPGEQPSDMTASLAKALGVSEAKVEAAMEDVMSEGGPPSGGEPPAAGTESS